VRFDSKKSGVDANLTNFEFENVYLRRRKEAKLLSLLPLKKMGIALETVQYEVKSQKEYFREGELRKTIIDFANFIQKDLSRIRTFGPNLS
jgi:hypothetical protein